MILSLSVSLSLFLSYNFFLTTYLIDIIKYYLLSSNNMLNPLIHMIVEISL